MTGPAPPDPADPRPVVGAVTRWGLLALAAAAALGAVLRATAGRPSHSLLERLDQTTLLYLVAAGGLLLLRQVKTLSYGQLKFEMIERLREQQAEQAERLADIALVLPLLLPDREVRHVLNLFTRRTERYQANPAVREELRRLRSIGLIATRPDRPIGGLHDGMTFDLADHVELTELGRRWAVRIGEIQGGEAKPPAGPSG
ncbi:MAG: hypothetical protein C0501_25415 [Isosphaera sp.]|nr:hypothetical protein [Isosphaera sp.]